MIIKTREFDEFENFFQNIESIVQEKTGMAWQIISVCADNGTDGKHSIYIHWTCEIQVNDEISYIRAQSDSKNFESLYSIGFMDSKEMMKFFKNFAKKS